jgi:hypothetical protein
VSWEFRELPVRPMAVVEIDPACGAPELEARLRRALAGLDTRSLVRVRLLSEPPSETLPSLRAEALRALAPPGMTVSVAWPTPRLALASRSGLRPPVVR